MPALRVTNPPGTVTVRSCLPSTDFYLAAGTVTIDPTQQKVLIIHDLSTDTFQLPRGRKDWADCLPRTAIRETFEETGYCPRLLAVPLSTRATLPQSALVDSEHVYHAASRSARFDKSGDVLLSGSVRLAEEPFAVMQHYQTNGALAIVSWFVGFADSRAEREIGTQMADEEYESRWVGYEDAVGMMVDEAYADVVRRVVELAMEVEWSRLMRVSVVTVEVENKEQLGVTQHVLGKDAFKVSVTELPIGVGA
ncbi:hypothetical protein GE09DRAFT_1230239 [Coniochaeta sp. 2T2.1]|nr:hypothetical protein GE09DRAFT_1230239 [Coniochaeta sp. 2T2.1]